MFAIYKKELKSYFHSVLGFAFIAVFVMLIGIYFMSYNMNSGLPYFSYTVYGFSTISMFTIPILTMKSFAEEKKSKADQMLLTAPVNLWQITIGKFLAMATVYAIPLLISCICPLIIMAKGESFYLKGDYLTILMLFLFGLVLIAVGEFISSLTESMIIAAIGSFAAVFLVVMWRSLTGFIPTTNAAGFIGSLLLVIIISLILYGVTKSSLAGMLLAIIGIIASLITYIVNASALASFFQKVIGALTYSEPVINAAYYSIFDLGGIVLYLSTAFIFIMLTVLGLHKRRWN